MILNDFNLLSSEIILLFTSLIILIYGIFITDDEKSIKNNWKINWINLKLLAIYTVKTSTIKVLINNLL